MKLAAAFMFVAITATAGVTYDFRMVTAGAQGMTINGKVAADGLNLRMEVDQGDGRIFRDDSIVISRDGGKTLLVFDPSAKTYFQITLEEMTRGAADALQNPIAKVTFDPPKASVRDAGDGGKIEGFPTRKTIVDASIVMRIDAMGQKLASRIVLHSENWGTDKIDPSARNLFQLSNPRTGIEAFDKMMDAQAAALAGRFPLKQITTMRVTQDGREMVTTTTATVTKIKQTKIDASRFADPKGYKKVDDPLKALMNRAR
ncbi:MAG: hypothetical protein AABO58_12885 [Acidobacteriota bacterium]